MVCLRFSLLVSALCAIFLMAFAAPDSADQPPLPGPGLSYGGIPYGSVSGNVAAYFNRHSPSSGRSVNYGTGHYDNGLDYAPIEQYL